MTQEAIILAGGLGVRLRSVLPDLPKCMAPIHGRPFLEFVLDQVKDKGIVHIIMSLGYKAEAIKEHFCQDYRDLKISYCIEEIPLGTGGAIESALKLAQEKSVFVLNGDTYLDLDFEAMSKQHRARSSSLTIAVKHMPDTSRYGTVEVKDSRILSFNEKTANQSGLINAGTYLLDQDCYPKTNEPLLSYSFEKSALPKILEQGNAWAFPTKSHFIDIGIPEDYKNASDFFAS